MLDLIRRHDSPRIRRFTLPPYLPSTRDTGADYRYKMTEEDYIKLDEALNLAKVKSSCRGIGDGFTIRCTGIGSDRGRIILYRWPLAEKRHAMA